MRDNIYWDSLRIGFVGLAGEPISLKKLLPGAVCYYFATLDDCLKWHRRRELDVVVVCSADPDHYQIEVDRLHKELLNALCDMELLTESAAAPSVILLAPNNCATSWLETGGMTVIAQPVDPSALVSCIAVRAQSARYNRLWRLFREVADAYRPEISI